MPMSPEARVIRARLAARRRWRPGDDFEELASQLEHEIELSGIDDGIDELVAKAPKMTPSQAVRIAALWWSVSDRVPGPQAATPANRAREVPTPAGRSA